jgi:hypothetical protein
MPFAAGPRYQPATARSSAPAATPTP